MTPEQELIIITTQILDMIFKFTGIIFFVFGIVFFAKRMDR